jgi:PKHD-type hydroxylase
MSVPINAQVRDAPAGLLVGWLDAFTPAELNAIEALGDSLTPMKAEIAGRSENTDHLRITRVAWIERGPQTEWLFSRVEQAVLELNSRYYKYELYGLIESFQYTVYEAAEGGHYDWHCDTGKTTEPRKISLTLQLSEPSTYEGGDLILEAGEGPFRTLKTRGTLVAFPSYVMHRVTPVTAGTRKSLVVWVSGPEFR